MAAESLMSATQSLAIFSFGSGETPSRQVSFSSVVSIQTKWSRKDVRGDVYLAQRKVNNEETQVMTKLPCWS